VLRRVFGLVDAGTPALPGAVFAVGVPVRVTSMVSRRLVHASHVGSPGNASPRSRAGGPFKPFP
jgi:hypothetical protein